MLFTLLKADAAQRIVVGRIDETPDRFGEVLDYATSKPYFEKWSADQLSLSNGLSVGNLRAMHGKLAAGILQKIGFDDAAKAIEFHAHVVDDSEWAKVEAGVYTGFSPGGKYLKKWKDGAYTRYTAMPSEVSLVDRPCIPSAGFTMVKGDGLAEEVPFQSAGAVDLVALLAGAQSRDDYAGILLSVDAEVLEKAFGLDAEHAPSIDDLAKRYFSAQDREQLATSGKALPDGSFPVETKRDVKVAIDAFGRAKDKGAAKAHIEKRAQELDAEDLVPEGWDKPAAEGDAVEKIEEAQDWRKGLWTTADLAITLQQLTCIANSVNWEAADERDGSDLPKRLAAWIVTGHGIFKDMVTEESAEAVKALGAAVAAIPDNAAQAMALFEPTGDLAKFAYDLVIAREEIAAIAADRDAAKADLAKFEGQISTLQKRVVELEALPRVTEAHVRAVPKSEDGGAPKTPTAQAARAAVEALPDGVEKATLLMQLTLASPGA